MEVTILEGKQALHYHRQHALLFSPTLAVLIQVTHAIYSYEHKHKQHTAMWRHSLKKERYII